MSQLILDQNIARKEDSEEEDPSDRENINKINNYKGIFCNEESEEEQRYYEYGAHFPYDWLCERLEELSIGLTHGNNSLYETLIKNELDTANDKGINKEVNFRRISTKDTKQSGGNERINGKKNNPGINYSNLNNLGNNFNKRFLFPKETVNKIPSVSLLNNASMSNIMENNIISLLNDNLNNNHKSRNVNKVDNVYNNGTVAVHEAPIRILNKENEYEHLGDNNCVLLNNNLKEFSKLKSDPNKHVTSTFKKEEKKGVDNFHVYTSYSNAAQKNDTGYKPLLAKKNANQFLNNKNSENMQNIPIVLVGKNTEEYKIKYNLDNFFNSKNPKKINSISKDKNSSSPNKDNNLMNKCVSKLNNYKKSTDSSKANIIIACSSKMGRNVNKSKLNPHNTNVTQTKTLQTAAVNKIKAENPQLSKFKQEIKKLNMEKIFKLNDRQSATASADNRNFHNANLLTRNKNKMLDQLSLSPGKIKVDTYRRSKAEKDNITISSDELKAEIFNNAVEETDKIKSKIGLTEIMSNLTKNNETKSRNAQRSHIAVTSSNLFSSDKAQSMQNVSYQKTDILSTQINKKNITLMKPQLTNCIPRQKPKTITVVNKSFTSHMNLKNKTQDVPSNCTAKKKVNNITIWSVAENKKIQIKFGTTNSALNTSTKKNEFLNSKEKENKLEIKNENVLGMKITNTKINWKPSVKAEIQSPLQRKYTNAVNTVNINTKNKSNSLNTNMDLGKGIGMSLIKNYKLNNNPTKISYNSKKSDSTASKSIYGSYSSNKNSLGLINILSTKSNKL